MRMNSKELLEQADQRIAEADLIKLAKRDINDSERLIKISQDDTYDLQYHGEHSIPLRQSMNVDNYNGIKSILIATFKGYLNVQTVKLEQLLGITPKIVNPEFEAAIRGMEQSIKKPEPLEDKLKAVLQDEAKLIESPDKSIDKYPAKQDKRVKTPSNMVEADIRRMYVDEGRDRKYIAGHYGISESKVNNYLFLHDIKRKPVKLSKKSEKQPEETERPSQA